MCDRVAFVREGELVAVEDVAELMGKAVRQIEVVFAEPVAPSVFEGVPGVHGREDRRQGGRDPAPHGDGVARPRGQAAERLPGARPHQPAAGPRGRLHDVLLGRGRTTMLRDPFFKGLRDQLRPLAMWSAGVAFYVALLISIYPSIRKSAGAIQEYVKNMPEAHQGRVHGLERLLHAGRLRERGTAVVAGADRAHRLRRRGGGALAGGRGGERHPRPGAHAHRRAAAPRAPEVRRHGRRGRRARRGVLALADGRHGHRRHAGRGRRPRAGLPRPDAPGPRDRQRHLRRERGDGTPAGGHRRRRRRRRPHVPAEHAGGDERDDPAVPLPVAVPLLRRRVAAGQGPRRPRLVVLVATSVVMLALALVLFERRDVRV